MHSYFLTRLYIQLTLNENIKKLSTFIWILISSNTWFETSKNGIANPLFLFILVFISDRRGVQKVPQGGEKHQLGHRSHVAEGFYFKQI